MNMHFFHLEPNFLFRWKVVWTYGAEPHGSKFSKLGLLSVHSSQGVEGNDVDGTWFNIVTDS